MAQVTADLQAHIDYALERLIQEWRDLPRAERDIDTWDLIEQLDYIEEWTPSEELRSKLERYAAQGLLNDQQMARLAELRHLVEEHQPILERLRNS